MSARLSRHLPIRLVSALVVAGLFAVAAQASAQGAPVAPTREEAPDDAYTRHLRAGLRLYASRDYNGAIAEFEAAYRARPGPSPLINVAVSYRELFRYPRAVEALERALREHGPAMEAADRAAAEKGIAEMRALFAYVTVSGLPPGATVRIGDDDHEGAALDAPIAVPPGTHQVTARAPGHVERRTSITAVSTATIALDLPLERDLGRLRVVAPEKGSVIEIDGEEVGRGTWEGELASGPHVVRVDGVDGDTNVVVTPGGTQTVDLAPRVPLPPPPPPPAELAPPAPPKRGFYALVNGAVLIPLRHPDYFERVGIGGVSSGAAVGFRGGFRVHDLAGFELLTEYGNVIGPANGTGRERYELTTWRVGPMVRLMTPGETFRLVGTVGGGLAYDLITLEVGGDVVSSQGADFFMATEVGGEVDLDGVLLGASFVAYLSGTKGMNDFAGPFATLAQDLQEPYGNDVLASLGPRVSMGFGFW